MDEKMNLGSYGLIILLLLFFWIFTGRNGFAEQCQGISNCAVERQGIIDSATTNYNILENRNQLADLILAENNKTREQQATLYTQQLRDALADEKAKNASLENRLYTDGKFAELERTNTQRFFVTQAELAKKPDMYPCYAPSAYPCGQIVPQCG